MERENKLVEASDQFMRGEMTLEEWETRKRELEPHWAQIADAFATAPID